MCLSLFSVINVYDCVVELHFQTIQTIYRVSRRADQEIRRVKVQTGVRGCLYKLDFNINPMKIGEYIDRR